MTITISPYALIDLATVKDLVGMPPAPNSVIDTRLTLYINSATAIVEKYCDRIIKKRSGIVETFDGRRTNKLLLHQFPIISVESLAIDSNGDFSNVDNIIDPLGYAITDEGSSVLFYNQVIPNGYRNVQVTYTAGFEVVPDDLVQAAAWMVEWFYIFNSNRDLGRTSRSKGDENTLILQQMPQVIFDTVQYYKRTEFPNLDSPVWNS